MRVRIQAYVKRDDVGTDSYTNFKLLDIGDYLGIEGYVFKTKTGETSIHAKFANNFIKKYSTNSDCKRKGR